MRRDSAMASATGVGARPSRRFKSDLAERFLFHRSIGSRAHETTAICQYPPDSFMVAPAL